MKFYYVSPNGLLGMKSNGSFTKKRNEWIIFTEQEKMVIESNVGMPYNCKRKGQFMNVKEFQK
jgi:hypothetical protein